MNASKLISTPIIETCLENTRSEVAARAVKAKLEKTTLGDIAESITEVYTSNGCSLHVKLDLKTIELLQLDGVTAETIAYAIIAAPKLKLGNTKQTQTLPGNPTATQEPNASGNEKQPRRRNDT
jgi:DNA-directed RNA polymerase III subunit RPC1